MVYKVLLLEDNEIDASLIEQYLKRSDYNFEVKWVSSGKAYEEALDTYTPDVIISDYQLKQYTGLDAIRYKEMECQEVPMLIVSGIIGEEKAVELIREGATDFVIKNNISNRLEQAVVRAIRESAEKEKRRRIEFDLKKSEKRFRMLFECSLDGIIIGNPKGEGSVIAANAAMYKMLGHNSDRTNVKVINEYRETISEQLEKQDKEGFARGELELRRNDGSVLPIEVSRRKLDFEDGEYRSYYIVRDVSDRKEYELKLKKEKEFIGKALDSLPGLFFMLDSDNNLIRINNSFESELGYDRQDTENMDLMDLYHPEDRDRMVREVEKAFSEGQKSTVARVKKKDGTVAHYYLTGTRFEQDGASYMLGTGSDISDRIEAEKKIKESLKEKEVLLTEIHHRVKNNLAVISGIMELQAMESDNEELQTKLFDSQSRIKSIALTHELLYQEQSFSNIDFNTNIKKLVENIAESINSDVTFNFDLDPVKLNINQALPCSLIINEAVTNALKHAFTGQENAVVEVAIKEEEDGIHLSISDNGSGLPEGFCWENAKTIGFTLIKILTEQLKGKMMVCTDEGTHFHLQFRKTKAKGVGSTIIEQ